MTDIKQMEQRALALLNEVRVEYPLVSSEVASNLALCRAIEQHEAFRQEVSDAVEAYFGPKDLDVILAGHSLSRFIIAKPDPLVEAIHEVDTGPIWDGTQDYANKVRAAIEKRGGKIVWGEG